MSLGLFIKGLKSLTPALAVLLIVALMVTPTLQAAIPGVYEVAAAEPVVEETPQEQTAPAVPPITIQKSPKKVEEARKAPALPEFDADLGQCADGIYTGTGTGYAGDITVRVKIKSHAITSIKIIKVEADDPPYMAKAKKVIGYILKAQSLNVDTVSGATFSSNGIISAVGDALNKAAGKPSQKKAPAPEAVKEDPAEDVIDDTDLTDKKFADGVYTGVGIGYTGEVHVAVTILNGALSRIEVTKHQEDEPYMGDAMALIPLIIQRQSVQVDTVTGATYSSRGIINAVKDALKKAVLTESPELDAPESVEDTIPGNVTAPPPELGSVDPDADAGYETVYGMYLDGTYKGLARGYKSLFQATVVIVDGNVKSINITHDDDEDYYAPCVGIIDRIITRQTTDGIDTVSGCTYSSKAILDSVNNALKKAKKPEMPEGKKEDEDDNNAPDPPDDDEGNGDGGDGGDESGPSDGGDESGQPGDGDEGDGGDDGGADSGDEPEQPGGENGGSDDGGDGADSDDANDDADSGAEGGEGEDAE
jgi:uncharacterized protein with FMN-binding domain